MDQNEINQVIENLNNGDTASIPILITALSIPAYALQHREIADALILFIKDNPDQKAFVQIILDSSTIDKNHKLVKELIQSLNN